MPRVTADTSTGPSRSPRTRLTPDQRRTQLIELGVSLLATRSLDELTIDVLAEEAGVSRGLLYHYFGNKQDFREAVVRRAVGDLVEQTAPPEGGEPLERLLASVAAYVDYVVANYQGYVSIVRGAAGGNDTLRQVYEETRDALTDRIFTEDAQGEIIPDTPAARLMVRGWSAMGEEMVLTWVTDPRGVTREQLLESLSASLPALVELLH
jgi:AcrR family transcriptional regulator